MPNIHYKYGGSTAARTMACPRWVKLAEELPPLPSSTYADEGTLLHECMELIFTNDEYAADPYKLVRDGISYNGIDLTAELYEWKLNPALEAVDDLLEEYGVENSFLCEPVLEITDLIGGSTDLIALSADKKTVIMVDYKFGYKSVNVVNNAQLMFYLLAAANDPKTAAWFDACERFVLAIIQPNDSEESALSTWEADISVLDTFETEYLSAVDESTRPNARCKSGEHCAFCPATPICPLKTGAAADALRVNDIMADRLAEYLPMAEEVMEWAKAVQKLAHEQLEMGVAIKGYKLVNKRATRNWTDEKAVLDKVRKARKLKLEEACDFKLKSPAQMEKLCKTKGIDFDVYDAYIAKVSSGTTMAKESDKRPAAIPLTGLEQLNETAKP